MLEHLDDTRAWKPDIAAVVGRGRRLRRRRRLLVGGVAAAACVVVTGVAGALYVDRRDEAIDRVDVVSPVPSDDGAVNVLLVGLDARGEVPGRRADTIAVLRLEGDEARVLFVPRDLWDPVTGERMASLGADPDWLVAAVGRLGLPIDYYVELDMVGFADLVDAVGGIRLVAPATMRDRHTGVFIEGSTCTTLDGDAALALVRSRHAELQSDDGSWVVDPTGDLGRIARAEAVVAAAVEQLASVGLDVMTLDRISRVLADHGAVDAGLSERELVSLGRRLATAGSVETDVLPTVSARRGQAAVLDLAADAPAVVARFGGEPGDAGDETVGQPVAVPPLRGC